MFPPLIATTYRFSCFMRLENGFATVTEVLQAACKTQTSYERTDCVWIGAYRGRLDLARYLMFAECNPTPYPHCKHFRNWSDLSLWCNCVCFYYFCSKEESASKGVSIHTRSYTLDICSTQLCSNHRLGIQPVVAIITRRFKRSAPATISKWFHA